MGDGIIGLDKGVGWGMWCGVMRNESHIVELRNGKRAVVFRLGGGVWGYGGRVIGGDGERAGFGLVNDELWRADGRWREDGMESEWDIAYELVGAVL